MKVDAKFPLFKSHNLTVLSEDPVKHFLVSKKPTVFTASEWDVNEYFTFPPLIDQR